MPSKFAFANFVKLDLASSLIHQHGCEWSYLVKFSLCEVVVVDSLVMC